MLLFLVRKKGIFCLYSILFRIFLGNHCNNIVKIRSVCLFTKQFFMTNVCFCSNENFVNRIMDLYFQIQVFLLTEDITKGVWLFKFFFLKERL